MKIKILISILVFQVGLNFLFLYFYLYEKHKNFNQTETINRNKKDFLNLRNKYFLEIKDNFSHLNPESQIISIQEDSLILKNIITDKPKLVFTFSRFTCSSCVENEIKNLKGFESNFGKGNIIILTNHEKIRDLVMFCKLNDIIYPIYNVDYSLLKLDVDQKHLPYYFVIKNDFYLRDIFIVNKDTPDITKKYLTMISLKYFQNE